MSVFTLCFPVQPTLKMEKVSSSETFVIT
jgi:hypothetical protein